MRITDSDNCKDVINKDINRKTEDDVVAIWNEAFKSFTDMLSNLITLKPMQECE